jgi:hypothetical protein
MRAQQPLPDVNAAGKTAEGQAVDRDSVFTALSSQASPSLPSPQTIAEVLW